MNQHNKPQKNIVWLPMVFTSRNILLVGELLRETFVHKIQANVHLSYYAINKLIYLSPVTTYFMYFKLWFFMPAIVCMCICSNVM